MGKQKMIYLTDDNYEKLSKEENASKTINELLEQHYNNNDLSKLTLEELKKLRAKELARLDFQKKLVDIDNGEY